MDSGLIAARCPGMTTEVFPASSAMLSLVTLSSIAVSSPDRPWPSRADRPAARRSGLDRRECSAGGRDHRAGNSALVSEKPIMMSAVVKARPARCSASPHRASTRSNARSMRALIASSIGWSGLGRVLMIEVRRSAIRRIALKSAADTYAEAFRPWVLRPTSIKTRLGFPDLRALAQAAPGFF
jgi:hypothetical protein